MIIEIYKNIAKRKTINKKKLESVKRLYNKIYKKREEAVESEENKEWSDEEIMKDFFKPYDKKKIKHMRNTLFNKYIKWYKMEFDGEALTKKEFMEYIGLVFRD